MSVNQPESAVNDPAGMPFRDAFSSGGGFSNIYGIPSYQTSAAATYFSAHDPGYPFYSGNDTTNFGTGLYNRIGRCVPTFISDFQTNTLYRGYPDVAAVGDNIAVVNEGSSTFSGGTSASSPIFASVVNLINEQRLNAGKTSIGFINPALYANPDLLNDITSGSNPGCGTDGFTAVAGWDPVTVSSYQLPSQCIYANISKGLGTPNFPKMIDFFTSLP
jgi:tripeptidyl-peptidase-1